MPPPAPRPPAAFLESPGGILAPVVEAAAVATPARDRLVTGLYTDAEVTAHPGELVMIQRQPDGRNLATWREALPPPETVATT